MICVLLIIVQLPYCPVITHVCVITGYLCFKHGSVEWKCKSGSTDELPANRTTFDLHGARRAYGTQVLIMKYMKNRCSTKCRP